MLLGRVLGRVWADRQLPALGGRRFVLVEDESTGARVVAVDLVDSGRGATVLVATDEAAQAASGERAVDAAVVALVADLDPLPTRSAPVSGRSGQDSTHHSRPPVTPAEAAP
ncbi:MAG TPA: EutN/CcmL family microcompartment protein [Pseudonocardia sp.]|jgi:ethanolamine utilization protein EutN